MIRLDVISSRAFVAMLDRPLTMQEYRVAECLRGGAIKNADELIDALYFDRPDGGADSAAIVMYTVIWRARQRGVPIINHYGRGYSLEAR